jgi:hypothetical protein
MCGLGWQVVALVGPSGGGKSSCVALLQHFYEPEDGMVLLDGQPVGVYEHHWFHRNVSIVGQVRVSATAKVSKPSSYTPCGGLPVAHAAGAGAVRALGPPEYHLRPGGHALRAQ